MGMTGISGQSLHCGPVAEPIVSVAGEGGSGGFAPETKHFHTCQSILFNNVVKMLKISQPVTFLPHPSSTSLPASGQLRKSGIE